jgi:hypothetical protein
MGLRPIQEAMYRWWSLPPAFFSAGPTGHEIAGATSCGAIAEGPVLRRFFNGAVTPAHFYRRPIGRIPPTRGTVTAGRGANTGRGVTMPRPLGNPGREYIDV